MKLLNLNLHFIDASVIVVGIGISKKRDIEELQKIATGRKNYMGFPTFKEYLKDVEKLTL